MKKRLQSLKNSKVLQKILLVVLTCSVLLGSFVVTSSAAEQDAPSYDFSNFVGKHYLDSSFVFPYLDISDTVTTIITGTIMVTFSDGSGTNIGRLVIGFDSGYHNITIMLNTLIVFEDGQWRNDLAIDCIWIKSISNVSNPAWLYFFLYFNDFYFLGDEFNYCDDINGEFRFSFYPGQTWREFVYSPLNDSRYFACIGDTIYFVPSGLALDVQADSYIYEDYYGPLNDVTFLGSYSPINFKFFTLTGNQNVLPGSTTVTAFTNSSRVRKTLHDNSSQSMTAVLSSTDFDLDSMSFLTYSGGFNIPYIDLTISTCYSGLAINGKPFSLPDLYLGSYIDLIADKPTNLSFEFYDSTPGLYYVFTVRIFLDQYYDITSIQNEAYYRGVHSEEAQNLWMDKGWQEGYQDGYSDANNSSASDAFIQDILGDTLNAPMDALNDFAIGVTPSGNVITIGLVVGGAISLILFLAFLKILGC